MARTTRRQAVDLRLHVIPKLGTRSLETISNELRRG
jgi:hypothetical protein